jgi:transcriptional regulator with XRE-family HTH domain
MNALNASDAVPIASQSVRALAVEAWRLAEAMGLAETTDGRLDTSDVAGLIARVRDAGIARGPALRFDNVEAPSIEETEALLRLVIAALEASPVAKHEWPVLARVLEADQLASLLGISATSLRRYASGERGTPDEVAARLHHLALIVGDLAGAYNEVGIRRWFDRARAALDGKSPAALLAGDWNPDDPAPRKVRDLARSLVGLSAT